MKTDVIIIRPDGKGIDRALAEAEKAAVYCGLNEKQALRLRLLAEEMTGMLRTIVGDGEYRFRIESRGKAFSLHLETGVQVCRAVYEELVKSASSGKNDAAKGFMGRIRDIIIKMCAPGEGMLADEYGYAFVDPCGRDPALFFPTAAMYEGWSMKAYREQLEARGEKCTEQWDELERSITANLADEVKVFIRGSSVELIVEKTF